MIDEHGDGPVAIVERADAVRDAAKYAIARQRIAARHDRGEMDVGLAREQEGIRRCAGSGGHDSRLLWWWRASGNDQNFMLADGSVTARRLRETKLNRAVQGASGNR